MASKLATGLSRGYGAEMASLVMGGNEGGLAQTHGATAWPPDISTLLLATEQAVACEGGWVTTSGQHPLYARGHSLWGQLPDPSLPASPALGLPPHLRKQPGVTSHFQLHFLWSTQVLEPGFLVQILPQTSCVTLGETLNFFVPQFLNL